MYRGIGIRQTRRGTPRRRRSARLFAVVPLFGAVGCGGLSLYSTEEHDPATLPSTIVSESSGFTDEELTPSESEGEPSVPELAIRASQVFCCNPLSVDFEGQPGSQQLDPWTFFTWYFGDGRTGTGIRVTHTYDSTGAYEVRLVAGTVGGATMQAGLTIELALNGDGLIELFATSDQEREDAADDVEEQVELFADAGLTRSVTAGETVTLVGTGYASDDGPLSYSWLQIEGTPVSPDHTDGSQLTFVAPSPVSDSEFLHFRFTVSRGDLIDTDDVAVVVHPQMDPLDPASNSPPTAVDRSATTPLDVPVVVRLDATDVDRDVLTFSVFEGPQHGELEDLTNWVGQFATVRYLPGPGFVGEDGFSFIASDGFSDSNVGLISVLVEDATDPAMDPARSVKFVPWVEMNANSADIAHVKAGLHYYELFCDRVIITPITGGTALIQEINQATSMSVIPSIKTYYLYAGGEPGMPNIGTPDYDNMEAWQRLANEIEAFQSLGYRIIGLENEAVILPMFREEHPEPDWSAVATGIDLLPKDVSYLLYPSMGSCGGRPRPMALAERYLQAWADGVPDVVFVDYSTMGTPECIGNERLMMVVERMRDIHDRLMPLAYLYPGPAYWGLERERFFEILDVHDEHYHGTPLILYPGNRAFTEAGRRLSEYLEVADGTGETD